MVVSQRIFGCIWSWNASLLLIRATTCKTGAVAVVLRGVGDVGEHLEHRDAPACVDLWLRVAWHATVAAPVVDVYKSWLQLPFIKSERKLMLNDCHICVCIPITSNPKH